MHPLRSLSEFGSGVFAGLRGGLVRRRPRQELLEVLDIGRFESMPRLGNSITEVAQWLRLGGRLPVGLRGDDSGRNFLRSWNSVRSFSMLSADSQLTGVHVGNQLCQRAVSSAHTTRLSRREPATPKPPDDDEFDLVVRHLDHAAGHRRRAAQFTAKE